MELPDFIEENRKTFSVGLVGLFLLAVGIFSAVLVGKNSSQPEVEILTADEEGSQEGEMVVDVEGAVERPGLYRLSGDVRVNDALVAAGGMSADADREWVARYLNLAQKISDGVKIYIPHSGGGEEEVSLNQGLVEDSELVLGTDLEERININTAEISELDNLWGIGEKRAEDIVANRPYASTDELLEKKVIPSNVYDRIKNEIAVY